MNNDAPAGTPAPRDRWCVLAVMTAVYAMNIADRFSIAALADRANRRNILAVSLAIWSGMAALCGLARSHGEVLLARFAVGIGEAGGRPSSTSILADKFPPVARPMALMIAALGACLGSWLGTRAS
jgi:MFS family permease